MTEHRLHERVKDLRGSLVPDPSGAPWLVPATVEQLADVVAAQRAPGARLQRKEDGCWSAIYVDADGVVERVDARSGGKLRLAAAWRGVYVGGRWGGWTMIGECVAGSRRARVERQGDAARVDADGRAREYTTRPRVALFYALSPEGERHEARDLEGLPDGMAPVDECDGDDWRAWTLAVLRSGGEGVVIRAASGRLWRAKGRLEVERVVHSTRVHTDRHGDQAIQLGLAVPKARRDRRSVCQWVPCPLDAEPHRLRGRVVSVRGSAMLDADVVRDGYIARLRDDRRVTDY